MAQPTSIELSPPKDMSNEATKPEQTTSGVKTETVKTLKTKVNITDIAMQGRRSFTFEYEGTFHNLRFYDAKVKFSLKLMNHPRVATIGNTDYNQFRITNGDGANVDSKYGPMIFPNFLADIFFEKATIEILGGTEIEPATQTHQITKLIYFHTELKPEDATFKYTSQGGYHEKFNPTTENQKYQLPITINAATGAITLTTGANYKEITKAQFTGRQGANNQYRYTTQGVAALAVRFHRGQEVHFEVPLRRLCRIAKCRKMFPAGKKYFITLFKAKESFLMASQDPAAHQNIILQLTDCTIEVPIVELQPDKQEEERKKITSDEGNCYSLTNQYIRTYYIYIYPVDTVNYNYNVTNGYKPKYFLLYWVDYTHESDGDISINNFTLERPNLRLLDIWVDDFLVKSYEPKQGENAVNWDQIYQDFIEWTGRTITSKGIWKNDRTMIPIKIDPNSRDQVKDPNIYMLCESGQVDVKQVFNGRPSSRQLRLCVQWPQSE